MSGSTTTAKERFVLLCRLFAWPPNVTPTPLDVFPPAARDLTGQFLSSDVVQQLGRHFAAPAVAASLQVSHHDRSSDINCTIVKRRLPPDKRLLPAASWGSAAVATNGCYIIAPWLILRTEGTVVVSTGTAVHAGCSRAAPACHPATAVGSTAAYTPGAAPSEGASMAA